MTLVPNTAQEHDLRPDSFRPKRQEQPSSPAVGSAPGIEAPVLPRTPMQIVLLLILAIFLAEISVMFLLHLWPSLPMLTEAIIDSTLLLLILSPTFYLLHYRPLLRTLHAQSDVLQKLAESEIRLQLALDAVNDGLWDWDIASDAVYFTPRCATMLGYAPEELEPKADSLRRLIHPDDRGLFERMVKEHFAGSLPSIDIELRLTCRFASRHWLWVRLRGKVVERSPDGTPLRAVGTNTDIDLRKQAEESLLQSEEGVRYLSRELIRTAEAEKKHLASELHDDFGQMISAFKLGVELIQDGLNDHSSDLDFHCKRLLEIGHRMESSLRGICDDLRPAILDDLGLNRTLEWLVSCFAEQHPGVSIDFEQPELRMRLPADLELVCYRICQEALHNISKHAKATRVVITLHKRGEHLLLSIRDNGRGFEQVTRRGSTHWGIGLLGIRERAAALGGNASIESHIGEGTTIRVNLPVDREGEL